MKNWAVFLTWCALFVAAAPAAGRVRSRVGQPVGVGIIKREMTSANVYRIDPSGRMDMMISEKELDGIPNGILFSPDYKKIYIVLTETGRHSTGAGDDA
jgi:gluconolactonase